MPSNSDFKLEILVADTPVPDYTKNGEYFVECNLSTPVSYMHQQSDVVNGETEVQSWPVTPYRIRIKASPMTDTEYPKYFRVLVDGVKVKGISLDPGESKVIKGFRDGPSIREFLFSMPRYAKDTNDRIESSRYAAVGKIVVECWDAVLRRSKWSLRSKYLDFKQANKKDSTQVTEGKYTMATSCPGKVVSGRAIHRLVDSWKLQKLRSTITVTYHMGHTLREMGFTLRSLDISPDNVRLAQRLREASTERPSVSDSKEVKREPMDIPDRPRIYPEVIDLTEDQSTMRSQQESAMDLSVRSANSDRAASDARSDDGYNSDNLCIVDDDGTPSRPARAEKDSRVDKTKERERTDVNNEPQTDAKESVTNDEVVEMEEVGEHDTDRQTTEHETDKEKETEKSDSAMDVVEVRDKVEETEKSDAMDVVELTDKEKEIEKSHSADIVEVPDDENDKTVHDKSDAEEKAADESKTAENENCDTLDNDESKTVHEIEVVDENENKSTEKEDQSVEDEDNDGMIDVAAERTETEERETKEVEEQKDEESSGVAVETEERDETSTDFIEDERIDNDSLPQESGDTLPEEVDQNMEKNNVSSASNLENKDSTKSKQNDSDGARVEDSEHLKTDAENEDFVVGSVEGDDFFTDEERDSTNNTKSKADETKEESSAKEATDVAGPS